LFLLYEITELRTDIAIADGSVTNLRETSDNTIVIDMMKFFTEIKNFTKRQPLKTMGLIIVIWIFLAASNLILLKLFPDSLPDTPLWFPISVSSNPAFNTSGLPYAILFLILLYWALKEPKIRSGMLPAYLVGLAFIILGNLIQGNADIAFRQPLLASNNQYYHDALKITSWMDWLAAFNAHQTELFVHSKTHPPFAVLLHYLFISLLGNHPLQVGLLFVILSSLSILIVGLIFGELGVDGEKRNTLIILCSAIPAVNIYTAVSLDGVILTTSTFWLLGLVILLRRPKFSISGALFFVSGMLLTNLFTFVGVFFFTVSVLVGILECFYKRKLRILIVTGVAACLFGLLIFGLNQFAHYDHIRSFFTASHIENPKGFWGLIAPLDFVVSRVECVGEIALFFSVGCLAMLLNKDRLQLDLLAFDDDIVRVALVAIVILAALFLIGLNRTGETARSCLFIYPFLLLFFYKSDRSLLGDLVMLAGLQTVIMQLFFWFFW
jgi:hypothetical protein